METVHRVKYHPYKEDRSNSFILETVSDYTVKEYKYMDFIEGRDYTIMNTEEITREELITRQLNNDKKYN